MVVPGHNYRSWWGIYWRRNMLWNSFYNVTTWRLHIILFRFMHLALCFPFIQILYFLSLSDMTLVRVSGYAAMCICRKCATTQCLGWRKKLCTSSGFVLLTRRGQDAHLRPLSPSSLQTPWNTPGPWVTHSRLAIKMCKMLPQLEKTLIGDKLKETPADLFCTVLTSFGCVLWFEC